MHIGDSPSSTDRPAPEVVYEDEEMVAVNKPAGISTIPDRSSDRNDVRNMVEGYLNARIWVVHRLDKPVSGVLLFAKNAARHKNLSRLFETRQIRKDYLALVHGSISGKRGTITAPVRTFGSGRVAVDEVGGKPCRTDYRVLDDGPEYSLLRVSPMTGRRHQIRVHLYNIGHPVVGDLLYGQKDLQIGYSCMMLHAWRLQLPVERELPRVISATPPDAFSELLQLLTGLDSGITGPNKRRDNG